MRARIVDFCRSMDGKQRLTLELGADFRADYDRLHQNDVEVTIKKYRPKRSLDANAYAWVLIDKIAERMHLPKAEVYKDHIQTIGGVSETVCVRDQAVDKLIQAWEQHGLGWCSYIFPSKLEGCTNVTLYYGSSTYDTKQMSALIDSLVQSCRILGIETMSPEKLNLMLGGENA